MGTVDALAALQERFPKERCADLDLAPRPLVTYPDGRASDQLEIRVPPARLLEVMEYLYGDPRCRFEQLIDVTCIDYLNFPDPEPGMAGRAEGGVGGLPGRFGVIYSLLSLSLNQRLWVKVFVSDPDPVVPSVTGIWKGAEWPEREVYDMFGIRFSDHPDLRRILMPANFVDYPLRKDYPLTGKGERESFEVVTRETA